MYRATFLVEHRVQQRAEEKAVWERPAEKTVHRKEIEVKSCEFQISTMHNPVASLDYSEALSQIQ